MRGSRVSALLVLLAFVAAFVVSAPMLIAEHAWDADAPGSNTGVTNPTGTGGTGLPDSTSQDSGSQSPQTNQAPGGTSALDQLLFQLMFLATGGGL
jgi:hypothetical protein